MEQETCPHCGTTKRPTAKLRDGERYFFCERCKKTITYDELDKAVKEQEVDGIMIYYYDSEKNHVIVEMEDWEKILKILKATGAEVILPVSETEELE
jgi:transposase-like protein